MANTPATRSIWTTTTPTAITTLDLGGDYAPGDNDVRHRLVLSGVWSLDAYTQHLESHVARAFLGGWSLSGIAAYQTGQPYTALVNVDLNGDGNARNDRAPGFARNSFNLPNQFSLDPRVTKDIGIWSGVKLQLIGEAFNLLNRSNVSGVRNTYYAVTTNSSGQAARFTLQDDKTRNPFGLPTASSGPRIIQLAGKISF